MRRAVICALVALVVVILQVSVVDGLPIPGVSAADPALVAVVAVGLLGGPVTGALIGFFAGLWLDLVPPGGHLIGSSALLLCLVGYCCGLLCTWLYRSVMGLLIAGVVAVAAGEAVRAAVALLASDPGVTLPAITHVLPVTVLYGAALCPIALLLAAVVIRPARVSQPRWDRGVQADQRAQYGSASRIGGVR